MKCLIDTNILISASLFPNSMPAKAFHKAVLSPNKAIICDWSIVELRRVYNKKWPNKIVFLEAFIALLATTAEIVETPPDTEAFPEESLIRDECDRPILRAALKNNYDYLLTGDKDFLESGITFPVVKNPADFVNNC